MQGIIHKAVRDYVVSQFGDSKWQEVLAASGMEQAALFDEMKSYPDDQTFGLVGSSVEVTGKSLDEVLHDFGVYWVRVTAPRDYGAILEHTGYSVREVLGNLNEMHEHISRLYPELQPPQFDCTTVSDNVVDVHYVSPREGLTAFAAGVIDGLIERFNEKCTLEQIASKTSGDDHDIFRLTWPTA